MNKCGVGLTVNSFQFDSYGLYLLKYFGIEKEGRRVERLQKLSLVFLYNRFKLENIAYRYMFSNRFANLGLIIMFMVGFASYMTHIGANHAYFVDDYQLKFA